MNAKEIILQFLEEEAGLSFDDGREAIFDILRENSVFSALATYYRDGECADVAHMFELANDAYPETTRAEILRIVQQNSREIP